jgi:hypothetical protein
MELRSLAENCRHERLVKLRLPRIRIKIRVC